MIAFFRNNQLDIMLVLLGLCGASLLYAAMTRSMPPRRRISLMFIEASAMILLVADRAAYQYRGAPGNAGYWMVRISNFLVFLMLLVILFAFNYYLETVFVDEKRLTSVAERLRICYILIPIGVVLLIISQFNGIYYTFDAANFYHRSPWYIISYVIPVMVLFVQLSVIIQHRKKFSLQVSASLLLFALLPLLGSLIQLFTYGFSALDLIIAAAAVILVLTAMQDMDREVEQAHLLQIQALTREEAQSRKLFDQLARALANAIDAKDRYTRGHSTRVAEYARMIAERSGKSADECDEIYRAAMIHDVGKIGTPDGIVNKKGKLTFDEYETVKKHPVIGREILADIDSRNLIAAAEYHHERYDGEGYPAGMKGEEIPELARIIAVADAYDAMTSYRSYRDPLSQDEVRSELSDGLGRQFDPWFGEIMIKLIDEDKEFKMRER